MNGIPITIKLDWQTLAQLERIAAEKATDVRTLLVSHVRASLDPVRPLRAGTERTLRSHDIDQWERLARAGVTNQDIARRFGVSKSLVSRYLIERGVRRNRRRTTPTEA